jgi:hypothetical protein
VRKVYRLRVLTEIVLRVLTEMVLRKVFGCKRNEVTGDWRK